MVSDFLTGLEYFQGQSFTESVRYLNDTKVTNLTSSYFLNATARICSLESEKNNGTYNFSCVEHHYWYGIMTFVFIYATSGMTLAALIGRGLASTLCMGWGFILGILGKQRDVGREYRAGWMGENISDNFDFDLFSPLCCHIVILSVKF